MKANCKIVNLISLQVCPSLQLMCNATQTSERAFREVALNQQKSTPIHDIGGSVLAESSVRWPVSPRFQNISRHPSIARPSSSNLLSRHWLVKSLAPAASREKKGISFLSAPCLSHWATCSMVSEWEKRKKSGERKEKRWAARRWRRNATAGRRQRDPADRGATPDCCRIVHRLVPQRGRRIVAYKDWIRWQVGPDHVGGTETEGDGRLG